ncbi:helix-turn-helix transcriptional regulator [Undibacterium terreum]|uniref:Transcriptional regulator n=1 Tax=Undibacterium terreum TaxID=1224302 RepID=A0A916XBC3_9BURK|nr:YafY family protein [Undibacterium terreum]GGC59161.1 transcriptional regulator [Undibacterium terreum]
MHTYRPTTRVLTVLELLQSHGRMSGAELARRLDVDGRTLRRYIVMLEELGIPITAERGRYGGYALIAGFKLPPMIFNDDEALALSIGLLAARSLGMAEAAPAVASAQAKLERVMPPGLEKRVRAVHETVKLDLPRPNAPGSNDALAGLSSAAQMRQRVRMRYMSATDELTNRDVDPYALAYQNGSWYVLGMCHLRQDLRSFRLDRVLDVAIMEQKFQRPEDFDAVAHLNFSIATMPRAFAVEVLLKSDLKTVKEELFEWMGVLEAADEGVILHSQTEDLHWYARELARLPLPFEIRHPPELSLALRDCAISLLAIAQAAK